MERSYSVFVFLALGLFTGTYGAELTRAVQTTKGPVRGEIKTTVWNSLRYSAFRGIPYARPPLGSLRFKPPVEPDPWTKSIDATEDGNACPQLDFLQYNQYVGDEDCLYLNVYTPQTSFDGNKENLKHVMVWIYGGGFMAGYANRSLYGPDFLLEEDVVVVSFNYRLGPLGFLSIGHPNATGNAGLKDQTLALKWVQANIANFGGDPNSVTLFGESAGAASADFHMLSDMSQGLFHRAISMSGGAIFEWAFHVPQTARSVAFQLGARLGLNTTNEDDLLQFLYRAPARGLIEAAATLSPYPQLLQPGFKPTIEDPTLASKEDIFLAECSVNKYKRGNFSKVPVLTGFTAHEALLVSFTEGQVRASVNYTYGIIRNTNIASLLKPFGKNDWLIPADDLVSTASSSDIESAVSDVDLVAASEVKRYLLNNSPAPIYYYRFAYDSPYSFHKIHFKINKDGATHFDDVPFIFHTKLVDLPLDQEKPLSIVRKRMVRMWTNFAKYSNPTPSASDALLNVIWPDSRHSDTQLDIGEELVVRNDLISDRAKFYADGLRSAVGKLNGC